MSTALERCEGRGVKGDGVRGSGAQRVGGKKGHERSENCLVGSGAEAASEAKQSASVSERGSEHRDAWKANVCPRHNH
jgi:hypothetical protein